MYLRYEDFDSALELFSRNSEQYMCQRSSGCGWIPPKCRGRGHAKLIKQTTVPQHSEGDGGVETTRLVRLQKFCRRAEEVARKLHLRGHCHDAVRLWYKVAAEAPRWDLTVPSACPNLEEALQLCGRLRGLLASARDEQAQARSEAWTSWCHQEWTSQGRKNIYKFCRGDQKGGIPILQKADNTLTGNYQQMDKLLRSEWLKTFRLYDSEAAPSWEAFEARYGQYFPAARPMPETPISPSRLREVFRRMNPNTSIGVDGWRVGELKHLPEQLLQRFCDLLQCIEATGKWPKALTVGLIAPLPKGEGLGPGDVRPITVTSVLYRAWAACRVQEVISWQEGWKDEGQSQRNPRHVPRHLCPHLLCLFHHNPIPLDGSASREQSNRQTSSPFPRQKRKTSHRMCCWTRTVSVFQLSKQTNCPCAFQG